MYYGFTLTDNQYDSFSFDVNMALDQIKDIDFNKLKEKARAG